MYKLIQNSNLILRIADNTAIPPAPANTDYQAYLKWVEEGGVPLPEGEELVVEPIVDPATPPADEVPQ